jgi:hypothetical protein
MPRRVIIEAPNHNNTIKSFSIQQILCYKFGKAGYNIMFKSAEATIDKAKAAMAKPATIEFDELSLQQPRFQ